MKYIEVDFSFHNEDKSTLEDTHLLALARDLTASLAGDIGFESFVETETGMKGYVPDDMFHKNLLDECLSDFPLPEVTISYTHQEAEYRDWNETWEREGFEPILIDNLCVIHDTLHLPENTSAAIDIVIDAKQAFGTGTHETTRLMVATMFETEMEGKRVLDCGCGTGILSIVASKLKAEHVTGYDIDEWSVENTQHNAHLNEVDGSIEVLLGDSNVLTHVSGVFDIILANINRNIIIDDMPRMVDVLASGGTLILSGFYEEDISLIVEKASTLGLLYERKKTDNGWAAIVLKSQRG